VELRARTVALSLAEPFATARGSRGRVEVVEVELEHEGVVGRGEGSPVYFWGESAASATAFVTNEAGSLLGDDPFALEEISRRLGTRAGEQAAKCALDGALHDWIGKRLGQPTWRLLGLRREGQPTSYTISIDTVAGTADRARRAAGFRVLKVKLGGPDDLARLEAVRAASDARIRVDCNEDWTLEQTRELMPALLELGVELLEQPLPAHDTDGYRALREVSPRLPVFVDEGCADLASVAALAAYADGINVKLAKAGGIREAVRMTHAARALGLGVMLGCMLESELGIAQAAQIASLADHVDLDGHLLLAAPRFEGLELRDGRVLPSDEPGLGVWPAGASLEARPPDPGGSLR
jgi:L-Ala-D/L-Glu epimerase